MMILENCRQPYIKKTGEIYACGQCESCMRAKATEWTIRGVHELQTTPGQKACFITLTYSPKYLHVQARKGMCPEDKRGNLCKRDQQLFIKRLRKWISQKWKGKTIKYMLCGEYGTKYWRPHYHMIIFGLEWNDFGNTKEEAEKLLKKIWKLGKTDIDTKPMNENAIQYVVGYTRKKIGQKFGGKEIYQNNNRIPPYMVCSRGIGEKWAKINRENWIETMQCGFNGHQHNIPRYYIRRIYKEEGLTIKFNVKKIDGINDEIITKYKVVKNPSGEWTQKALVSLEILRKKKEKQYIKENEQYAEELKKYFLEMAKKRNDYLCQSYMDFEDYTKKPIEVIYRLTREWVRGKTERTKQKNNKRELLDVSNHNIFERYKLGKFYEKIKNKGWEKCENYKERNIYGRREKYEDLLEWDKGKEKEEGITYIEPWFEYSSEIPKEMEKMFRKMLPEENEKITLTLSNN